MKHLFYKILFITAMIYPLCAEAQITGTKTIGSGGDYSTFTDAVSALYDKGISGSVIFNFLPGIYEESVNFNRHIPGSSLTDTVVFQSSTGNADDVILGYQIGSPVYLYNTSNITLQKLTFKDMTSGAEILSISDTLDNINILNNVFIKSDDRDETESVSNGDYGTIYDPSNDIIIRNNNFIGGKYGIHLNGDNVTNLKIENNKFDSVDYAIRLESFDSPEIVSNIINSSNGYAVFLKKCTNKLKIFNNKITGLAINVAFELNGCTGTTSDYGLIANNLVQSSLEGYFPNSMIFLDNSSSQKIYFNTINITDKADTLSKCIYIRDGSDIILKNNIESNESGGICFYTNSSSAVSQSDYNDYNSTGDAIISWEGNSYSSLYDFRNEVGSQEIHSTHANPFFISDTNMTPQSTWISNRGDNSILAGDLLKDYYGNNRDLNNPDMGAIEYNTSFPPLTGSVYIIGHSPGANFASLSAAVIYMEKVGLQHSIKLQYADGDYDEHLSFGYIPGLDKLDTLVVESQSHDPSAVNIFHSNEFSSNYMINMPGTDFITFKDLTFTAENSNGKIFVLGDNSNNNNFINDVFEEKDAGGTGDAVIGSMAKESHFENLLFDGCKFTGGFKAINLVSGTNSPSENFQISNCYFDKFASTVITVNNIKNLNFSGNEIQHSVKAADLSACSGKMKISKNELVGNYLGLELSRSHIGNLQPALIANNFVGVNSGRYALKLSDSRNINVYYNSFNSTGIDADGPAVLITSACENINLVNNIFAGDGMVLQVDYPSSSTTASDYNDFYTGYSKIIKYHGTDFSTFTDYQTATSQDANSISTNPGFESTTDLHACSDSVASFGTPSINSVVGDDIDGEMRDDKSPSIGADEFSTNMVIEDFERWDSKGNPVNWLTDNLSDQGLFPIIKTSDAFEGSYAMEGKAVVVSDTLPIGIAPIAFVGPDGYGISFTKRAKSISFHLNYSPLGGDELIVFAFMYSGQIQDPKPIGIGIYRDSSEVSGYKKIVMPIHYMDTTSTPEHLAFGIMVFGTVQLFPNLFPIQIPAGIKSQLPGDITFYAPHPGTDFVIDQILADTSCSESSGDGYPLFTKSLHIDSVGHEGKIIAGEKNDIYWLKNSKISSVNLYYSLDNGNTFNIIDKTLTGNVYIWDTPDSLLSRKSVIKVQATDNPAVFDTGACRIKPWLMTKLDSEGNYIPFEVDKDGWSFGNSSTEAWPSDRWDNIDYQNGTDPYTGKKYPNVEPFKSAKSKDFPPWRIFVKAFSVKQCYSQQNSNSPLVYKSRAKTIWAGSKSKSWKGSCYGFAVTSLLYFYHKSKFIKQNSGLDNHTYLKDEDSTPYTQNLLAEYWAFVLGKPFNADIDAKFGSKDARQTLADLKEMLLQDNGDAKPLTYYNSRGTAGHTVTPYRLDRIDENGNFKLVLYNNNRPGDTSSTIVIDSLNNRWIDKTGFRWGKQKFHLFLNLKSSKYLTGPIMPKTTGRIMPPSEVSLKQPSPLTLYNNGGADITVTNTKGEKIDFSENDLKNNIEGCVPIIPLTGTPQAPLGYWLPDDNYTVTMTNCKDTTLHVFFLTDTLIYNYRRSNVDSTESDRLNFAGGLNISNPDTSLKEINLETIIDGDKSEKSFVINNFKFSPGDSLRVKAKKLKNLLLQNFGSGSKYDMRIRTISGGSESIFILKKFTLSSNSSQLIKPDWDNLNNSELKILIDKDNDGSFDDTVSVSNQATGIKGLNSNEIPHSYKLYQNYPNPFNPSTTIKYELPEDAFVTLKIYDILGREVKTLVSGKKSAGKYEINFNAANLASGIYFYRLKSNSITKIRKMILMK